MILALTDETWLRLRHALLSTPEGADLWRDLTDGVALPPDRELVRLAREGSDPPPAVARVRDARNAGIEAAAQTREEMARMVRHIHGAGVPAAALARWFDLKSSRIYEILAEDRASV
jgi:hypothetical protein